MVVRKQNKKTASQPGAVKEIQKHKGSRPMINWGKITKWGVIAGSLSALILFGSQIYGMADATGYRPIIKLEFDKDNEYENHVVDELKRQINLVVDKMSLIEWEMLYTKMKVQGVGTLSFAEMQKLCLLTRQLQFSIPECPGT